MDQDYKEVYFYEHCKKCKYFEKKMVEDPCNECLEHPTNYASHKPVKFEERDSRK